MALYREDIVDIELESGSLHRSWMNHAIGLGDVKANRFGVRIFRNGEAVNIGSGTCQGFFMRPDGTNLQIQGSTYTGVDGNKAWVQLPQDAYAYQGQFCLAIKLIGGGVTGTMRIIDGMVDNTGTTGAVSPTSTVPTSQEIIAAYNNAVAVIDNSVRFDIDQSLTAAQKAQAISNIGAATEDEANNIKKAMVSNENTAGFAGMSFDTVSGTAHSSTKDVLYFDVKSGEKFWITLYTGDGQSVPVQVFANGSNIANTVANGTKREYTASSDLSYFGIYIASPNTTTFTFIIENENSLLNLKGAVAENTEKLEVFTELVHVNYEFSEDGYIFNAVQGKVTSYSGYKYTKINVLLYRGAKIKGTTAMAPNTNAVSVTFTDENDRVLSYSPNPNTGRYTYPYILDVPENAVFVYIPLRIASESDWIDPYFELDTVFDNIAGFVKNSDTTVLEKKTQNIDVPVLRNGSAGNGSNANAVTTKYVVPIKHEYESVMIQFTGDLTLADKYAISCIMFKNTTDGMEVSDIFSDGTNYPRRTINENSSTKTKEPYLTLSIGEFLGYDHLAVYIFRYLNNTAVPIRIATDQYSIRIVYSMQTMENDSEVQKKLNNARHIKGETITPLTILHFSDIHGDKAALGRIVSEADSFGDGVDEIICTGDIVNNSAGQIDSWWNAKVLTCIGNHDSASYSNGSYDWTALSMANRDAYYIAPFESGWGITHTSGKSYYYKDYATQKVRLIVMDAMLYTSGGTEATDQTTWLSGLLSSAITNNLHVLIAIHAPHGGATAKECSFSRYGQTTMPTYTDCNTPQDVIDAVTTAITNGLHFIGYIVGHTHQDNIWDAESNGKQLMYCITCAITSEKAQWKNSDQNRNNTEDAYNLVTIDTANSLVKIVRGGGADIDDHMRTRKAICIDYSTGVVVGEIL